MDSSVVLSTFILLCNQPPEGVQLAKLQLFTPLNNFPSSQLWLLSFCFLSLCMWLLSCTSHKKKTSIYSHRTNTLTTLLTREGWALSPTKQFCYTSWESCNLTCFWPLCLMLASDPTGQGLSPSRLSMPTARSRSPVYPRLLSDLATARGSHDLPHWIQLFAGTAHRTQGHLFLSTRI